MSLEYYCSVLKKDYENWFGYTEEHNHATKISNHEPRKAILLGRLRFKPDSFEPTTAQ